MSKLLSRKFWVWFSWTVLTFIGIVISKAIEPNLISWYGVISAVYIGGNTAQHILEKKDAAK